MASAIYLISTATGSAVNYYLSGSHKTYSGSGSPWTAQNTTPYDIGMDDQPWTPQIAQVQPIFRGGPPFRSAGAALTYKSYTNVTETVIIKCRGTTHNNAVAMLQQLRRILNTNLVQQPVVLAFQPNGSTNTAYSEIEYADVQEDTRFINQEARAFVARATVTWVRKPFFGMLASGESQFSATTFTNTGTGGSNNTQAFTSASGELNYEGQPLNVLVNPAGNTTFGRFYVGSVYSRTYSTTGAASYSSTSTTTGTFNSAPGTFDISAALTRNALKPRILMRFTSVASIARVAAKVSYNDISAGFTIWQSPWIDPSGPVGLSNTTIVDFGTFSMDLIRLAGAGANIGLSIGVRSTTGASASVTLGYVEFILYYEWCQIDTSIPGSTTDWRLKIQEFQETSNRACLPLLNANALAVESNGYATRPSVVRGTLPQHHDGASLYLAWVRNTDYNHDTADTAAVTASAAPLWRTARGSD